MTQHKTMKISNSIKEILAPVCGVTFEGIEPSGYYISWNSHSFGNPLLNWMIDKILLWQGNFKSTIMTLTSPDLDWSNDLSAYLLVLWTPDTNLESNKTLETYDCHRNYVC